MESETSSKRHITWDQAWELIRQPQVRLAMLVVLHCLLFAGIYFTAYQARYDFDAPAFASEVMLATLPVVVFVKLIVFYFSSHFHGWWRYVTFSDLGALLKASLLGMIVVAFVDYFLINNIGQIPRSVILVDTLLTVFVIGALKCSWRFADERFGTAFKKRQCPPAILVGTDPRNGLLASQINANPSMPFRVKGLISLRAGQKNRRIAGLPIVGTLADLAEVTSRMEVEHLLVPCDSLEGREIRELIQMSNRIGLTVKVLPRFEDALAGSEQIPLRELKIEDLLKRDPVQLDREPLVELIRGKRVLVTGAGGSIGSEICRQLLDFQPVELVLLGRGENRIYHIHRELHEAAAEKGIKLSQFVANITDADAMRRAFKLHQPELVFHAAAHKHVPLMELHVAEALRNNVLGTQVVTHLAHEFACSHFVMVSTDKAVNPTSVMGASKHLAERVVYAASQSSNTKFCVVRFGNVLGSAGSVVPLFQKQIRAGGPITITDPRMTRYFMSIPEASQLVLQASSYANGGEIFVLDMGEPVKIMDLAKDLIELSGLTEGSIDIKVTGIRDGEKLYEEVYFDDEQTLPTKHPKVKAAYHRPFEGPQIEVVIEQISQSLDRNNDELRELIKQHVPEYASHSSPSPDDENTLTSSSESALSV